MIDQEILNALGDKPFEPNRVTFWYLLGGGINVLAMIFLLLAYLGVIVLIAYLFYYGMTHPSNWFTNHDVRAIRTLTSMLYLFLLFLCPILILFLLKPIFIRPSGFSIQHSLDLEEEPLLFSFVERLAELMDVPAPKHICVTRTVTASISITRVRQTFFKKSEFVLTIGLPLVKVLSLAQFTGVLAHELRHFSQFPARFFSRMVSKIDQWFFNAIYERDSWDRFLEEASQSYGSFVAILANIARGIIGVTRLLLSLLRRLGEVASFFTLRQLEYDADRWQAKICGCTGFRETHEQLALLSFCEEHAIDQVGQYSGDGIQLSDIPQLIVDVFQRLGPKERETLLASKKSEKQELLSTHPSLSARIKNIQEDVGPDCPGRVQIEEPAVNLFRCLDFHSQKTSQGLYEEFFGDEVSSFVLRSPGELFAHEEAVEQASREWSKFSLSHYQPVRCLMLDMTVSKSPADVETSISLVQKSREAIIETYAPYAEMMEAYDENDDQWNHLVHLQNLYTAGFPFTEKVREAKIQNLKDAQATEKKVLIDRAAIVETLAPFEEMINIRLAETLSLLRDPNIASRITNVDFLKAEVELLLTVYHSLQENFEVMLLLRNGLNSLMGFPDHASSPSRKKQFLKIQRDLVKENCLLFKKVREDLKEVPYPLEHPGDEVLFLQAVIGDFSETQYISALLRTIGRLLTAESDLRAQILGRLATIAMQVEETLGMPPLGEVVEATSKLDG